MKQELFNSLIVQRIRDSGPQLAKSDLEDLQDEFGLALPADYSEFLLLKNGGCFYDLFAIEFPREDKEPSSYFRFHAVNPVHDQPCGDLFAINRLYREKIPAGMLVIGVADEGLLLLSCLPSEGLYLWHEATLSTEGESNRGLDFLAASFTAFAGACRKVDSEARGYAILEDSQPYRAIELRNISILDKSLNEGFDLTATNSRGQTALFVACRTLNYEAAELLLSRGADPNDGSRSTGRPPLYAAAGAAAGDLCKLLLANGASRVLGGADAISVLDILPNPAREYIKGIFESSS